jgi:thiamine-phosphate diphosphorylase
LRKREDLSFEDQAEQCCQGGAEAIFLSAGTDLNPKETVAAGLKVKDVCRKNKVLFIIGSRPDIALAVDADGVQLGPDDVSIDLAKQILGPRKIVGVLGSSLAQIVAATEQGAAYIVAGPLFTASKNGQPPLGIDIIRLIKKRVKIPVLASGAITLENVAEVINEGADGAAVSRAVCGAVSPKEAAVKFVQLITAAALKNKTGGEYK